MKINHITLKQLALTLTALIAVNFQPAHAAADIAAVYSPDGKQMAFVTDREGDYEIYLANADGSQLRNLSFHKGQDLWPTWSPDAKQIAYSHGAGSTGPRYIYIINADGTGKRKLTEGGAPRFSPDGSKLIYNILLRGKTGMSAKLYSFDLISEKVTQITSDNETYIANNPAYSPDGKLIVYSKMKTFRGQSTIVTSDSTGKNIKTIYASSGQLTDTQFTPNQKRIVFADNASGQDHIFSIKVDGSDLRQLTTGFADNRYPRLSHNGDKVLFSTNRMGGIGFDGDIFSMNIDGSNVKRITKRNLDNRAPSLARDNTMAFLSTSQGNLEIYLTDKNTNKPHRLTKTDKFEQSPEISPDGQQVLYHMNANTPMNDIHIIDVKTKTTYNLTRSTTDDREASWSPDGSKVVFESVKEGKVDIFIINNDGTNRTRLTDGNGWFFHPRWSADGKKVIYSNNKSGNWDLYSINIDGSGEQQLTQNEAADFDGVYSPDGRSIVFISNRDEGDQEIYTMNADGTNQVRLLTRKGVDEVPRWSGDGQKVIFEAQIKGQRSIYSVNKDGSQLTQVTVNNAKK